MKLTNTAKRTETNTELDGRQRANSVTPTQETQQETQKKVYYALADFASDDGSCNESRDWIMTRIVTAQELCDSWTWGNGHIDGMLRVTVWDITEIYYEDPDEISDMMGYREGYFKCPYDCTPEQVSESECICGPWMMEDADDDVPF